MDPVNSLNNYCYQNNNNNNSKTLQINFSGNFFKDNKYFVKVEPQDTVCFQGDSSETVEGGSKLVTIVHWLCIMKINDQACGKFEEFEGAILKPKISEDKNKTLNFRKAFLEEMDALSKFSKYDCIINLLACGFVNDTPMMIQEAGDMDLQAYLQGGYLTTDDLAASLISQIKKVLRFFTENDYVWLDAKPDNFVVFLGENNQDVLKAIDFGSSIIGSKEEKIRFGDFTPEWISIDYLLKAFKSLNLEKKDAFQKWIENDVKIDFSSSKNAVHDHSYFALTDCILNYYVASNRSCDLRNSEEVTCFDLQDLQRELVEENNPSRQIEIAKEIFSTMAEYEHCNVDHENFKGTKLEKIASHLKDLCQSCPEKRIEMGNKYGLGSKDE